eukprot:TRINITY_DN12004_c0_g1_i1.p1 TRINITY_DN12004_c0_g1~~TRINITY_DN12004_c0_g1_i1.p1  ORF type:complete len:131 (-),score=24.08 TRINITY_DN12004_c0_g1_i1:249-641(-)
MLLCGNSDSCRNAQFTIDVDNNAQQLITYWEGFKFPGAYGGAGATFIINNNQGIVINIERIECSNIASCEDTTFIIGHDVSIGEIVCSNGSCVGCSVKIDALSPGIPCDPNAVPPVVQGPPPGFIPLIPL